MINRVLIRIKVVQMLYSYLLTEKLFMLESQPTPPTKEKRFAYKLYLDLLALMADVACAIQQKDGYMPLLDNRFIKMIISDEKIKSIRSRSKTEIYPYSSTITTISKSVKESAIYKNYINAKEHNMMKDMKILQDLFNIVFMSDTTLNAIISQQENFTIRGVERMKELMETTFLNFSTSQGHITDALKSLKYSLEKAHELYYWMLLLPIELTNLRIQQIEANKNKFIQTDEDINPNLRFVENKFVEVLSKNDNFTQYIDAHKLSWSSDNRILLNLLLKNILDSEIYKEYMDDDFTDINKDCDLWRNLFKNVILTNTDFLEALEDKSVYWNDDVEIIGTFVVKTIKKFASEDEEPIMPMYKDDEDSRFGEELFQAVIKNKEEYKSYIDEFVNKESWDVERLAFMDVVLTLTAVAEMLHFPKIPIKVTVNEYIELAKSYSTVKSGIFVNGILASIINSLKANKRLLKED